MSVQGSVEHTEEESSHQVPQPRNNGTAHRENYLPGDLRYYQESGVVLHPGYLSAQQFMRQENPNHWVQNMEPTRIRPWQPHYDNNDPWQPHDDNNDPWQPHYDNNDLWQPRYDNNRIWIMDTQWSQSQDNSRTSTCERTNISLSKILKRLVFCLLSPVVVSIGIIIGGS